MIIDKTKNLAAIIINPEGYINSYYYDNISNYQHYQIFRNYIYNVSKDTALQDELQMLDVAFREEKAQAEKQGIQLKGTIETNRARLATLLSKHGYIVLLDATDYKNGSVENKKHSGVLSLPTNIENLSDQHKYILEELADETIIDKSGEPRNKSLDKITFFTLQVSNYNGGEINELPPTIGEFDAMIEKMREESKRR